MKRLQNYAWMAGFALLVGVVSAITSAPIVAQAVKAALVKNVDERGRAPYGVSLHCVSASGNSCLASTPLVPTGKRLVVEHVTGSVQLRNPGVFTGVDVFLPGVFVGDLPASSTGNDGAYGNYAINESLLLYVEPGQTLTLQLGSSAVDVNLTAFVTGYLIDLTI